MSIPQIILLISLVILLCLLGLFVLFCHHLDKKATRFDAIGTTLCWQNSKLPLFGRIIVEYTKKGKPYQAASGLMLKPKPLKLGAKNRWSIYTYHIPNKAPVSKAKRYKCKQGSPTVPRSPSSTLHKK